MSRPPCKVPFLLTRSRARTGPPSSDNRVFVPTGGQTDGRRVLADRKGITSVDSREYITLLPFGSSWSVIFPVNHDSGILYGSSFQYHAKSKAIYVAYGQTSNETYSSQFWRFSLVNLTWESLTVIGSSARTGCSSVIIEDQIWFFGGLTTSGPIQELHYIDLNTLEVVKPETTGKLPPAGANPLMVNWRNLIVIWANAPLHLIYIFDTNTLKWTHVFTEAIYRLGTTGTVVNDTLYIFGSSIEMTLLTMKLTDFSVSVVRTDGIEPFQLDHLITVAVGAIIFAFEASGPTARTRLFVLDTERLTWHCHPLANVTKEKTSIIVAFYLQSERKLVSIWGGDDQPQTVAELQLGEPLAQINHSLDFLAGLEESTRHS